LDWLFDPLAPIATWVLNAEPRVVLYPILYAFCQPLLLDWRSREQQRESLKV